VLPADSGDTAALDEYQIVSQLSTFKVNPNNTTTAIEQITARSVKYDVTFTFNVPKTTYVSDGAPPLVALKTGQVNQLAGHEHVVAVRGEEDQGLDGNLYNYLVVTVGTPDGERTSDVRIRMDNIGLPSAFGAVDAAWNTLVSLGSV